MEFKLGDDILLASQHAYKGSCSHYHVSFIPDHDCYIPDPWRWCPNWEIIAVTTPNTKPLQVCANDTRLLEAISKPYLLTTEHSRSPERGG